MRLNPRTLEGYREKLVQKTGAKNIGDLVVYAAKVGWLESWLKE